MNERISKIGTKIKQESGAVKKEVARQTVTYIVASLSLVAGLAWNEAIKQSIEYLFPLAQNTLLIKFLYAAIVTVIVVILTVYLTRVIQEEPQK